MPIPERTRYDAASSSVSSTLRQLVRFANAGGVAQQTDKVGFWSNVDGSAQIQRFRERLFIGNATAMSDTRADTNGTWVPNALAGANWIPRDSMVCAMTSRSGIAISGMARVSQGDDHSVPGIALAAALINDGAAPLNKSAWCTYVDVQHEREDGNSYGVEYAVKNKTKQNIVSTPYNRQFGTVGIWFAGGGDPSYGGSPVNPCTVAIQIGSNSSTWNTGIVMLDEGLTRDRSGFAVAVSMARRHQLQWFRPDNTVSFMITSDVTTGEDGATLRALANGFVVENEHHQRLLAVFNDVGSSADSYCDYRPGAGSTPPRILTAGKADDIDLQLRPKGAGVVQFGTHTATPLSISGYVTIKDEDGATRKLAVVS